MNDHLTELFQLSAFAGLDYKDKLFRQALLHELRFHYDNNGSYRSFCVRKDFSPHHFEGPLSEIPWISVHVFKTLGDKLQTVPDVDIKVQLQSSATSGQPSIVFLDRETAKRQVRAMANSVGHVIGKMRRPFLVVDVDPNTASVVALGARGAAIRGYLNFASSTRYLMKSDERGELQIDRNAVKQILFDCEAEPVVVFGFTYVIFSQLIAEMAANELSFELPEGSQLLHIGGWKKLADEKVSKAEFNEKAAQVFGIEAEDVIDIYGFTEQMGLNYPDCSAGWKHVPDFAHVIVRDPITRDPMPDGATGLLEFLTPIPHSYAGNAILTDDLGVIDPNNVCACGRSGRRFRVVGRAKRAEVRGCGDIMADRIIESDITSSSSNLNIRKNSEETARVFYPTSGVECLPDVINRVKKGSDWLKAQDTNALIGLIDKAAKLWQEPDFELSGFRQRGLAFLVNWCKADNLSALADFSLYGRRGHLDGFLPVEGSLIRHMRALPRGIVGHWLSGNVPVLGMLTLVQSILTRNANILKVASRHSDAVPALLKSFEGLTFSSASGRVLCGDKLLESIAVVYFDRSDRQSAELLSRSVDVRLAWGGAEAVGSIASLPKKWTTQDIIFGPKLSYMVIGSDALSSERSIRRLLRRAATDVSVFDQTGCASPHTIFIERGGQISPREFASRLAVQMDQALVRIPRGADTPDQAAAVATKRAIYEFTGDVWASDDESWTVLYDEEPGLADPTYSRVITVRPVDDIMMTVKHASEDIQTIGLAAGAARKLDYAEAVTARGVERCPDIGMMTHFEVPWDGMVVMDRLVRWSTMGGPG